MRVVCAFLVVTCQCKQDGEIASSQRASLFEKEIASVLLYKEENGIFTGIEVKEFSR